MPAFSTRTKKSGDNRFDSRLDYEMYPDAHCHKTKEILEQEGWPESYVKAVISHGGKYAPMSNPLKNGKSALHHRRAHRTCFCHGIDETRKSIMDLTENR